MGTIRIAGRGNQRIARNRGMLAAALALHAGDTATMMTALQGREVAEFGWQATKEDIYRRMGHPDPQEAAMDFSHHENDQW